MTSMRPWHMRGDFSRAFIQPGGIWRRLYLYYRGWRPHLYGPLWSKRGPLCRIEKAIASGAGIHQFLRRTS